MRIRLFFALLLFPFTISARETVPVRGRIVNEKGEAVEYVQVGISKLGIGAVSSVDGRFEIDVPADTLEFHHVSYQTGFYPVSGPQEDVLIVLQEAELPPAVFIGGDTKEKYLLRAGKRIPGTSLGFYHHDGMLEGRELGSVARARKPFMVKDILFSIQSNYIPGCVASINIYRIEGKSEEFVNILHKPIYVSIPESDSRQKFDIRPDETILLEPGRYFIAFQIVSVDEDVVRKYKETPVSERTATALHLYTAAYFKGSYERSVALGKLNSLPVNIGIVVKGLEYQ
ncbi:MAG: hypothetical protein IKW89_12010 [Bacteroidales bacterium]|nr:hypothetical protein [Bacteroidales bacterium]